MSSKTKKQTEVIIEKGKVVAWRIPADAKDRKFGLDTIVHSIVTSRLGARSNRSIRSGPVSNRGRRYEEMIARRAYRAEELRVRAELKAASSR